ncbi:MAG: hypothetical protein WCO95_00115 [Actinomycetes bacterium]|jgi:hypothetical protein
MTHLLRYSLLMVAGLFSLFSGDTYATNAELDAMRHSHVERFHHAHFSSKRPQ